MPLTAWTLCGSADASTLYNEVCQGSVRHDFQWNANGPSQAAFGVSCLFQYLFACDAMQFWTLELLFSRMDTFVDDLSHRAVGCTDCTD